MSEDTTTPETGAELAVYDQALFPELLAMDADNVRARFAERFMRAETIDDLFDVLSGNTSKDLAGRKMRVLSVAWAPYESDRGVIPLAICNAADLKTGDVFEFATTSEVLTMFIRRAELIGELPFEAQIAKKLTRNGQTALNFERV